VERPDKQTPVIQFNSLSTEAERDEQRGFLYLFKGIVGLRNSKAHSNTLFDDPSRAHEYLFYSEVPGVTYAENQSCTCTEAAPLAVQVFEQ
jgi:Protein of unknown function (Hypoth_ymh)